MGCLTCMVYGSMVGRWECDGGLVVSWMSLRASISGL
jgi:hypothetical protein